MTKEKFNKHRMNDRGEETLKKDRKTKGKEIIW